MKRPARGSCASTAIATKSDWLTIGASNASWPTRNQTAPIFFATASCFAKDSWPGSTAFRGDGVDRRCAARAPRRAHELGATAFTLAKRRCITRFPFRAGSDHVRPWRGRADIRRSGDVGPASDPESRLYDWRDRHPKWARGVDHEVGVSEGPIEPRGVFDSSLAHADAVPAPDVRRSIDIACNGYHRAVGLEQTLGE